MAPLVVALGRLDVALHLHRVARHAHHGGYCKEGKHSHMMSAMIGVLKWLNFVIFSYNKWGGVEKLDPK